MCVRYKGGMCVRGISGGMCVRYKWWYVYEV